MKPILLAFLLFSTSVFAAEGDIHLRLNGRGTHHHVPPAVQKSLNSAVYGFSVGYELPYNFIISAGVFQNSIKDYGSNDGRTSNFWQIENRVYDDKTWSAYVRVRQANNYYQTSYPHSWKTTVGIDVCRKIMSTDWDGCLTHVPWSEGGSTITASALVVRTTFGTK